MGWEVWETLSGHGSGRPLVLVMCNGQLSWVKSNDHYNGDGQSCFMCICSGCQEKGMIYVAHFYNSGDSKFLST